MISLKEGIVCHFFKLLWQSIFHCDASESTLHNDLTWGQKIPRLVGWASMSLGLTTNDYHGKKTPFFSINPVFCCYSKVFWFFLSWVKVLPFSTKIYPFPTFLKSLLAGIFAWGWDITLFGSFLFQEAISGNA